MAVSAADLLVPRGDIDPDVLFPGAVTADLETRLSEFILDGMNRLPLGMTDNLLKDRATRAWAYHRAFQAVFVQMSARPTSIALPDGSESWSTSQADRFARLAEQYRVEFFTLIADPSGSRASRLPPTGSVSNRFTF